MPALDAAKTRLDPRLQLRWQLYPPIHQVQLSTADPNCSSKAAVAAASSSDPVGSHRRPPNALQHSDCAEGQFRQLREIRTDSVQAVRKYAYYLDRASVLLHFKCSKSVSKCLSETVVRTPRGG